MYRVVTPTIAMTEEHSRGVSIPVIAPPPLDAGSVQCNTTELDVAFRISRSGSGDGAAAAPVVNRSASLISVVPASVIIAAVTE